MKIMTLIFILIVFSINAQSIKKASEKKITRNVEYDIYNLIPSGEVIVDIMDEVVISPRLQQLQAKFMRAMQENQQWFMEQQKIIEATGKGIPYDPKLGMTKQEWEEYKVRNDKMTDMQAVSSGKTKIMVDRSSNFISFTSAGKLSFLNSVSIDVKKNTVTVLGHILRPVDTVNVNNSNNIFRTQWRGYEWEFSDPEHFSTPRTQEEQKRFTAKLYKFTLGLFARTGQTFIEVSVKEIVNGKSTVNFEIPFLF